MFRLIVIILPAGMFWGMNVQSVCIFFYLECMLDLICTLTEKLYYYSYIGSYLKAIRAIVEIWNSILCFYNGS